MSKPTIPGYIRRVRAAIRVSVAAIAVLVAGAAALPAAAAQRAESPTASWLAYDATTNSIYAKRFTRLAVGRYVEVWAARGLTFPSGDCRNTVDRGSRVRITPAHGRLIARAFDTRIYPRETALFGRPRARDGRDATRAANAATIGSRTVVLIDNVRDENFRDRNNASDLPYIAGFYSPALQRAVDRNVVTLDAYDWAHRTGTAPPHRPSTDACRNAPARPTLYEGVLAHEYHHLLHNIADSFEETWVSEGLADYASAVTGYIRPATPIDGVGFAGSVQCLLGWTSVRTDANPRPRSGGPENSLTLWGDAGANEIVCDYGAAYTFVQFLVDRYGSSVATALHRDRADGLDGVRNALGGVDPFVALHDWAAMLALDGVLERGTPLATGASEAVTSRSVRATINWDNPRTHASPGAPPNGSDYVRLRDANGAYVGAAQLGSLTFASRSSAFRSRFAVQLVAYGTDPAVPAARLTVPLDASGTGALDATALRAAIDPRADVVAAIVTYEDPRERIEDPGAYELTVNGVLQPGGS